jgi:hypothetical protein
VADTATLNASSSSSNSSSSSSNAFPSHPFLLPHPPPWRPRWLSTSRDNVRQQGKRKRVSNDPVELGRPASSVGLDPFLLKCRRERGHLIFVN